eukprot:448474_1
MNQLFTYYNSNELYTCNPIERTARLKSDSASLYSILYYYFILILMKNKCTNVHFSGFEIEICANISSIIYNLLLLFKNVQSEILLMVLFANMIRIYLITLISNLLLFTIFIIS